MAFTLDASVGGVASNAYLTVAEYLAYLETSFDFDETATAPDDAATLGMATRLMEALYSPSRRLIRPAPPAYPYYLVRPPWTGAPASTTQALLWPRTGMYNRVGVAIASNVIPQELKNATAELTRQLKKSGGVTDDYDVAVKGISSVKAGSVSVSFRDNVDILKVIPDIVFSLLVPSWLTDELYENASVALFDVVAP